MLENKRTKRTQETSLLSKVMNQQGAEKHSKTQTQSL